MVSADAKMRPSREGSKEEILNGNEEESREEEGCSEEEETLTTRARLRPR